MIEFCSYILLIFIDGLALHNAVVVFQNKVTCNLNIARQRDQKKTKSGTPNFTYPSYTNYVHKLFKTT